MRNLFRQFLDLIPDPALQVGTVTARSGELVLITLPGGGTLKARGAEATVALGQHQRGVGGGIAVRGVARRLHPDPLRRHTLGQAPGRHQIGDRGQHVVAQLLERVHRDRLDRSNKRSCSRMAKRSVMPAM